MFFGLESWEIDEEEFRNFVGLRFGSREGLRCKEDFKSSFGMFFFRSLKLNL